jgi:hypothetical protein
MVVAAVAEVVFLQPKALMLAEAVVAAVVFL